MKEGDVMSKRMMLKFGICVLFIVSVICAILFKNESIKRFRQNKDFEEMCYVGLTDHDLFHS